MKVKVRVKVNDINYKCNIFSGFLFIFVYFRYYRTIFN